MPPRRRAGLFCSRVRGGVGSGGFALTALHRVEEVARRRAEQGPQLVGDATPEAGRTFLFQSAWGSRLWWVRANRASSSRRSCTQEGGAGAPTCWGCDPGGGQDFFVPECVGESALAGVRYPRVFLRPPHLVEQEFGRFELVHRIKQLPQHPDLGQHVLGDEELLAARAG